MARGSCPRGSRRPPPQAGSGVPATDGSCLLGRALGRGDVKGRRTQCPFLLQGWKRRALLFRTSIARVSVSPSGGRPSLVEVPGMYPTYLMNVQRLIPEKRGDTKTIWGGRCSAALHLCWDQSKESTLCWQQAGCRSDTKQSSLELRAMVSGRWEKEVCLSC